MRNKPIPCPNNDELIICTDCTEWTVLCQPCCPNTVMCPNECEDGWIYNAKAYPSHYWIGDNINVFCSRCKALYGSTEVEAECKRTEPFKKVKIQDLMEARQ